MERPQILGIPWDQLPLEFRRRWWQATDYGRHPPPGIPLKAPQPVIVPVQAAEHVQAWLNRPDGWRAAHAAQRARQEEADSRIMGHVGGDRWTDQALNDFAERMPELLGADQAKFETKKRERAADIARARELLLTVARDCATCLRPASPCQVRCLRSLLHPDDRRA